MKKIIDLYHQAPKKEFFHYSIAQILPPILGFVLVPFYTGILTPEDYGVISVLLVITFILRPIILLGANRQIEVDYFKQSAFRSKVQLGESTALSIAITLLFTILIIILSDTIQQVLFRTISLPNSLFAAIPVVALSFCFSTISQQIFQNQQKSLSVLSIGSFKAISEHILSILILISLYSSWLGRYFGIVISSALSIFYISYLYKKHDLIKYHIPKFSKIKKALKTAFPLVMIDLSVIGVTSADRISLSLLDPLSHEAVGYYTIAFMIGGLPLYFIATVLRIYNPYFFKHIISENPDAKINLIRGFILILVSTALFILVTIFISPLLFEHFVNSRYIEGLPLVPIIAFSFLFQPFYYFGYNLLIHKGKSLKISTILVLSFLMNILLNIWLIPKLGMGGACYATLTTYSFQGIAIFALGYKNVQLPWKKALKFSQN